MLFRKKIPVDCRYCARSADLSEGDSFLCSRYGVVSPKEKCRKFQYDPCKRIPMKPKTLDFSKYKEDDFSL